MTPRLKDLPIQLLPAIASLGLIAAPVVMAQDRGPKIPAEAQPSANFDPSDVYFQGWLLTKDAETLKKEGRYSESLEKLRRAQQLFDTVAKTFPKWKADMVSSRRKKTFDAIAAVSPEALAEKEKEQQAVAELEGGRRVGGSPQGNPARQLEVAPPPQPLNPPRPVETLESRRIAELEREVAALQQQIRDGQREIEQGTAKARAAGTQAQRQLDMSVSELQRSRHELNRLRQQAATAPVQEEFDALSRRINGLEKEKAAMARALETSRSETQQAKAQIDALQKERGRLLRQVGGLEQKLADQKRDLEMERQASNEVVAGQLKQIKSLQTTLASKDKELAQAQKHITSLETALQEVRDSLDDVEQERDELLRERDQMASLLKLNEASQLQQVIDQNMALDRELRETRDRYEMLQADGDASKEDLLEALRDLAISKMRIQEFRREKAAQDKRIEDLQDRLSREHAALSQENSDPLEAAMLRGIINKQLRIQEKRNEARQLLMDTLKEKALHDEEIRSAIGTWQTAELNLTPEEMAAIDGREVDGVIVSPYARPRSEVAKSLAALEGELQPYRSAGTKAYRSNRLHAAREAFGMILDRKPGDIDTMCTLGLIEYEMGNAVAAADLFQQAAELDPRNPYAFRMLGHILSKNLQDHREGIIALKRSTELAPTNAKGHHLLADANFREGDLKAAEENYKVALSCDPTSAESHHNLALLYAQSGKRKNALRHYTKALELGAPPNLELEKRLGH